jgi:hypothetical protein
MHEIVKASTLLTLQQYYEPNVTIVKVDTTVRSETGVKSVRVKSSILKSPPLFCQCCNGHLGHHLWCQVRTMILSKNLPEA